MIVQLSIDVNINNDDMYDVYEESRLKRIICEAINNSEFELLGSTITASWKNLDNYKYDKQF